MSEEVWIVTTDCDCMSGRRLRGVYATRDEAEKAGDALERWDVEVAQVPFGREFEH